MALDGITIAHLAAELAPQLSGARIDKIHQPEKEEIHLILRQQGQSLRLLLNVNATSARFHLTSENKKNPSSPPMFCMILRKHLEGGRILNVEQDGLERTVKFLIQTYNEYSDLTTLTLYLEIMGKHSNLVLVDASGQILDGLKRYSHALSRHREVLPGRRYLAPPSQGKADPMEQEEHFREVLFREDLDAPLTRLLLSKFSGISPELAQEIVVRAGLDNNTHLAECGEIDLARLFQAYRQVTAPPGQLSLSPTLYFNPAGDAVPLAFSFISYQQYQGLPQQSLSSLNEAVRLYYQSKSQNNTLEAKRGSLLKIVQQQQTHLKKKLAIHNETIDSAGNALTYQKWGELLTANVYRIPAGSLEIAVEDYHDPDLPLLTIPLDPSLSAIENAGRYYHRYNKAKATLVKTEPLRVTTLTELDYLDSLVVALNQAATPTELEEIQQELIEQGYLSAKPSHSSKKNKPVKAESKPRAYHSSTGRLILVGKNNRQNDRLTLKTGRPDDLWLHVQKIPGSHVLVPLNDGEEFPDDHTLEEAAALAIYYSQARGSSVVPVDYTHIKHLKKPNGSKPGMVVYEKHWTLYLTPGSEILQPLLAGETALL